MIRNILQKICISACSAIVVLLMSGFLPVNIALTEPPLQTEWIYDGHNENLIEVDANKHGFVATASRDSSARKITPDGNVARYGNFSYNVDVRNVAKNDSGAVFATTSNDYLRMYLAADRMSGSRLEFNAELSGRSISLTPKGNDYVYVTTLNDSLFKYNTNGQAEWSAYLGVNAYDLAEVDEFYYVVSHQGLHKFDDEFEEVWLYDEYDVEPNSVALDDEGYIYTNDVYDYMGTESIGSKVHKVDSEGNRVWTYDGHFQGVNEVVVDESGYVYSAGGDNTVSKLTPKGHRIWSYETDEFVRSIAVDANGFVYIAAGEEVHKVAQPPEPPQPEAPEFSEEEMSPGETLLSWSDGLAAVQYSVEVARDQLFGDPIGKVTDIRESEFELLDLEAGQTYYWRVKAHNALGTSSWSEAYRFTTEHPELEAPELISPEDESTEVAKSPLLSWDTVTDADNYELVVSETEDFSSTVTLDKSRDLGNMQYSITGENQVTSGSDYHIAQRVEDLDPETEYFWRVRAMSGDTPGEWSSTRSFETREADSDAPDLASPLDQEEDVSIPVALDWADLKDAANYEVQVSPTADFDSTLKLTKDITSAEIGEFVADTTTYYWRARAVVDDEATGWSEAWRFVTELRPPETPEWNPEDGDTDVEELILKWDEAARAESYNLQLAKSEDFDELIIDESQLAATEFEPDEELFDPSETYYWKVKAVNDAGKSDWSDPLSFSTAETVSAERQDEHPDEYRLEDNYPNPFNPVTTIEYRIPESSQVELAVYNTLGQRVATLVNEQKSAGYYTVDFDGAELPSGVYIYRMEAGSFSETQEMMLVK